MNRDWNKSTLVPVNKRLSNGPDLRRDCPVTESTCVHDENWDQSTLCSSKPIHTIDNSYNSKKSHGVSNEYQKSLIERYQEDIHEKRIKKEALVGVRLALRKRIAEEFPTASEEKLAAETFKMLSNYEEESKKMCIEPIDSKYYCPNIKLTCKDRRYKEFFHNGIFKLNETEGYFSWTCCMNERRDSKGCVSRAINPDRWMLDSI